MRWLDRGTLLDPPTPAPGLACGACKAALPELEFTSGFLALHAADVGGPISGIGALWDV